MILSSLRRAGMRLEQLYCGFAARLNDRYHTRHV